MPHDAQVGWTSRLARVSQVRGCLILTVLKSMLLERTRLDLLRVAKLNTAQVELPLLCAFGCQTGA
eukprot:5820877-Amphidinium_carterae.1